MRGIENGVGPCRQCVLAVAVTKSKVTCDSSCSEVPTCLTRTSSLPAFRHSSCCSVQLDSTPARAISVLAFIHSYCEIFEKSATVELSRACNRTNGMADPATAPSDAPCANAGSL